MVQTLAVEQSTRLVLDNLKIEGFRAFRRLQIDALKRVNLVVGKNAVGKTTLLEALRLYSGGRSLMTLWGILWIRDEISSPPPADSALNLERLRTGVESLFHRTGDDGRGPRSLTVGPVGNGERRYSVSLTEVANATSNAPAMLTRPALEVKAGEGLQTLVFLDDPRNLQRGWMAAESMNSGMVSPCVLIRAERLHPSQAAQMWDNVALTDLESDVLGALRIIAPGIERLSFMARGESTAERVPVVKLSGARAPVPLRSLGDGMSRLLEIALALANAKDGLLLVDEIENGIHYSAQPDAWKLIFEGAARLNVQVFATTHSWDCIKAYQTAATGHPHDALLIRLDRRNDEVTATTFPEHELAIATRDEIEVR